MPADPHPFALLDAMMDAAEKSLTQIESNLDAHARGDDLLRRVAERAERDPKFRLAVVSLLAD